MSPSISTVGEQALVARLRARLGPSPAWVLIGVGDDAAVLQPERGTVDVVTTDSLIEDVHFKRAWAGPAAIGAKALAVSLSDLAAMGARPRASLLSLAMPADWPLGDFDALVDGVATLAAQAGAPLVGGNMTRSPGPLMVTTTAIGSVRARRVLTRSGGRAGHALFLTGSVGAAAAGLGMRTCGLDEKTLEASAAECLSRYDRPEARSRCGSTVGGSRAATAAIDLSDGLADAARQLAAASGTGVTLDAAAIPIHPAARAWARTRGLDPMTLALSGGEDYELLFAVSPRLTSRFLGAMRRCRGVAITRVGRLTADPEASLQHPDGTKTTLPAGFAHF